MKPPIKAFLADESIEALGSVTSLLLPYIPAERGFESVVRAFLNMGADIEAKTPLREAALCLAVEKDHAAIVRLLIEKGANVGAIDYWGSTSLHVAARNGNLSIIELLLDSGANIHTVANDSASRVTPLSEAVTNDRAATAKLLLDRGSNFSDENRDLDGYNLLHFAASRVRNPQVLLKTLLERGADLESKDRHGGTPLTAALRRRRVKALRFLLKWGADPSVFKPSINSRFKFI